MSFAINASTFRRTFFSSPMRLARGRQVSATPAIDEAAAPILLQEGGETKTVVAEPMDEAPKIADEEPLEWTPVTLPITPVAAAAADPHGGYVGSRPTVKAAEAEDPFEWLSVRGG